MGTRVIQYLEFTLRSWWAIVKGSLVSLAALFLTFIGGVFLFGRYTMEAQKDRQITEMNAEFNLKIISIEQEYRIELQNLKNEVRDKEKESAIWQEKYFHLLLDKGKDKADP